MKKFLSILVIMGISISPFTAIASAAKRFPDVEEYHQYANEINYIVDNSFAGGFTDGTFKPENKITRAELTKIVTNAKFSNDDINNCLIDYDYATGEKTDEQTLTFPDVANSDKFANFICMAKENEIIKGYSNGDFRPNNEVTFGEAAKVVMRTLDENHTIDKDSMLSEYLNRLTDKSAVPPTLNTGEKDKAVTRGEVAHLIQIINDNYIGLPNEPDAPAAPTYNFMIKRSGTHSIQEEGLTFKARNFGLHCTTSKNTFIDLDVTKDGQTQQIHLERSCTGLSGGEAQGVSTHEADLFGYHFKLDKVLEHTAWDIDSFEFYIKVN